MYERFVCSNRQMWSCRYISFIFFLKSQNALNTNCNSAYFVGVSVRIKDDNPYKIPLMMPGTHLDAQSLLSCLFLAFCGSLLCSSHPVEITHARIHWSSCKSHFQVLRFRVFDASDLLLVPSPPSYLETFLMRGPALPFLSSYLSGLSSFLFLCSLASFSVVQRRWSLSFYAQFTEDSLGLLFTSLHDIEVSASGVTSLWPSMYPFSNCLTSISASVSPGSSD